jgi:ABC-2 type transport system permease protein
MPEAIAPALLARAADDAPRASASVLHLLSPKLLSVRARATRKSNGAAVRSLVLGGVAVGFWTAAYLVLVRLLAYFRNVPDIGPLLAGKLLGLILLCFFSILLLSNVITALSSFFLARDLDILATAPVDWLTFYLAKLGETLVHSSWMVVLLGTPLLAAYGTVFRGGPMYPLVVLAACIPFLVLPAVAGSAATLILVNVFPARRTRDLLSVIAVVTAAGVVVLFRAARPEQLVRPEGFRNLVDFIASLQAPASPWLPSEWVREAIMAWVRGRETMLPYLLLWSTAGVAVVAGAALHRALYAIGFSKAQESGGAVVRHGRRGALAARLLAPLGPRRREFVLKEIRLFFRDSTQWSQLVLLAVLVVVYVFNVRLLPLSGAGVSFFLVNVVPFLNLGLAGFVLASIAARFIFPSVSLEGRTLWLLRSSPMAVRDLLWAKFWVGTLPLLALALGLVGVTNALLQVSPFMFALSLFSITFITFALAGLALGFGTLFPQYDMENAAQIPTSFGGLAFMMASITVIAAVIMLEARPVYDFLRARTFGGEADPMDMLLPFAVATSLCIAATIIPLRVAQKRLERGE